MRSGQVPHGLALPPEWHVLETWGPGPFTTGALLERPDGTRTTWTSRRHRKRLGLLDPHARAARHLAMRRLAERATPASWWMGALFAIGAACFAVASLPLFFDNVDAAVAKGTFFVGSVFFTSAALLQFREAAGAPVDIDSRASRLRPLAAMLRWQPRHIDWWAALIQAIGTVCFNVSTFAATRTDLTYDEQTNRIWAPDVYGSLCFLVASVLAYLETNRGVRPRSDGSVGWRIAVLNLAGSVFFGLSALGARYVPTTGEVANVALVNAGTFLGAVCFFVGAVLLPVESARDASPSS